MWATVTDFKTELKIAAFVETGMSEQAVGLRI